MDTNIYQRNRAIVIWLFVGVGMIIVQVLLGGITRLTGSGLSITEWKPIMGALPPMNEQSWQQAFEKYQQIAQYQYVNDHFTLQDFKHIFFWEWLHRNWARFIGIVFFVPFVIFIIKKKISREMIWPMVILFILGGLQGAIGWIMVQSGLNDTDITVSHIRLSIHFIAALVLLCYVLWFALKLSVPVKEIQPQPTLRQLNNWILILLTVQLIYGGFMAGLDAALAAATWPDINGQLVPRMSSGEGFMHSITHNLMAIHFIHRGLAYLLTILIAIWFWKSAVVKDDSQLHRIRILPLLLVLLQVFLGVITVLNSKSEIPLYYALLHQFVGMLLLMAMVWTRFLVRK
ncbi:COX15/CtaA family protein [Chitinophaga horti]|uniref:COX15/CtaA family protein n=1 Tax=Chitinophaga horti TaxID=2920382 RepID=A0ABY6J3Y3_9BACT|nr:COX15/CtaA family protein [Chitinophaga horti]UYQ92912.1 COX15/CtaA family protein [Chitinophaga horti]